MTAGRVNSSLEATIPLQVVARGGDVHDCQAIIDTGFDGELLLPAWLIQPLNWRQRGRRTALLGDGSRTSFTVYRGVVRWNGVDRPVQVLESYGDVLIGMRLLKGHRLTIDAVEDGVVSVVILTE